jgi:hypothetical protein
MPNKSFLIFVSIGAIVTMAFTALAKNMSIGFGLITKKNVFTLLFISILNSIILFAITYLTDDLFLTFWVFCFVFLLFGLINISVIHEKFLPNPGEKKYVTTFSEIFFSIAIVLFVCIISSLLQYFLRSKDFLFYPVLFSGISFIVPLFFYYTYEAGINIPPTDFLVWEYPVSKRIDPPDEGINENTFVIGFDISKKALEKKTSFRAKAPENIILGELFYHFINEYNEEKSETPIEYLNEYKEPIVWWFRLKRKWYEFNKVLDPSQRIRDNFIKENSVIVCEQLVQTNKKSPKR